MYLWHKFWSRKTWNVVQRYVETYCPEGGIVLDPFAGSGVVAMEALRTNRRAIVCDILPIATEIIRLTIKSVDTSKLLEAFERVEASAKNKILSLYETRCRKCKATIPLICSIWDEGKCVEIRYACPRCGQRMASGCTPDTNDRKLISSIQKKKIREWYPKNKLYYPDGRPFLKKEHYESLDELFTKRNLQALAWLLEAIESEPDNHLRDLLKVGFTSMIHLCSKMMPDRPSRPFSSVWNEHSYWYATRFMEQNVWEKFKSAIIEKQGILKAKEESNQIFEGKKISRSPKAVLEGKADLCIHTGDCIEFLQSLPEKSVDYIFTDPPYDASVQFGELAYLWVAWLKKDEKYLDLLTSSEIVRNQHQHKPFDTYHALLRDSFSGMHRVLKPSRVLTVTFHNPTFKVRNATIRAGVFAGFEFLKVHYQEIARASAKSLLQPFGSAVGDFYLRFAKPDRPTAPEEPLEIDEKRFEKVVVETTTELLAERAEPTPYAVIINFIDPRLAQHGYFSSLQSGLDVRDVLKSHLGNEFVLVDSTIGSAEGKLWWFKDPAMVTRLTDIPISERVEETVYRLLHAKGKISFTDAWEAVSVEFPNSLTTDSTSIKEALQMYGRPVTGGSWLLDPKVEQRISQHTEIIEILADIGKALGFRIWIGTKEQAESLTGLGTKKLRDLVDARVDELTNVVNRREAGLIDVIWIKRNKALVAFEVESTTTMTEALRRGSNIESPVDRYMVLPEERQKQFQRKMKSPMFNDHFVSGGWQEIYFDQLSASHKDLKQKKVQLSDIVGKTASERATVAKGPKQLILLEEE